MAAVALALQDTSRGGLNVTFSTPDAVDGVTFNNRKKNVLLVVKNGGASPINVTLDVVGTVDGMTVSDRVVAVPAGATMVFGPFPPLYMNASNLVKATFSAIASVGVAAIVPASLMV